MEQSSFNSIQNNFKKFLGEKLRPTKESPPVSTPSTSPTWRIERMEQTNAFGRDDCEIGHRVSFIDTDGKWKTKIIPSL